MRVILIKRRPYSAASMHCTRLSINLQDIKEDWTYCVDVFAALTQEFISDMKMSKIHMTNLSSPIETWVMAFTKLGFDVIILHKSSTDNLNQLIFNFLFNYICEECHLKFYQTRKHLCAGTYPFCDIKQNLSKL